MEKLDRLGWAAGISFRSYGLRIGIRVNSAEVLDRIKERLPFGWKPSRSPVVDTLYSLVGPCATDRSSVRRGSLIYRDIARLARTADLDGALNELEIDLHSYIATSAPRRVFLHAGVVGWRGQAIVIPGKNFCGKTSLVTALLRAGATYYSDEFAVIDERGWVHPYPWDLHIREDRSARPRQCPVESLGGKAGDKPLPVGLVVISEYRHGAKWRPRPLSQGQAALAMMMNVISARHRPETVLLTLGRLVSQARVLKGVRGEAGEVVCDILNRTGD